jgi:hypothetical protein
MSAQTPVRAGSNPPYNAIRRGCVAAQTGLRSLRRLDCVARHDEETAQQRGARSVLRGRT